MKTMGTQLSAVSDQEEAVSGQLTALLN